MLAFFLMPDSGPKPSFRARGTGGAELIDVPNVAFARNLVDWKNKPVDSLAMDIFYPTGATSDKKYPVIVFCYGGGFSSGTRTSVSAMCDRMADKGYIVVAADYRTGYTKDESGPCMNTDPTRSDAIYRACQDINSCFRFLMANANLYNIDTTNVFLGGSSAGADLSMEVAYISDSTVQIPGDKYNASYTKLGSLNTTGNSYTNKYKLKGIWCQWGSIRNDKLIDTTYRAIPVIIYYGGNDDSLPDSMGNYQGCPNYDILFARNGIYARMQNQNRACVYYELSLANHSAYDDVFCCETADCFFKAIIQNRPYSGKFTNFQSSCQ